MNKHIVLGLAAAMLAGTSLASVSALAQTGDNTNVPGHPRVNEVDQRLENQQDRINAGEQSGQINANQAAHDENRDANIAAQASKDEAKNGGHLTKKEQHNLNRRLNNNSKHIRHQRRRGDEKQENGGK